MRTVSFSNPEVRRLLNNRFVNTYTNTKGDPTAGMSIGHRPGDQPGSCIRGNGKQNVQTIFMTPEGEIFHVTTGFLSPGDLLEEARYADSMFRELVNHQSPSDSQFVVTAHRKRLLDAGFSEQETANQNPVAQMMMFAPGANMNFTADSSGMRLNQSSGRGQDIFEGFKKRQFLQDNQFSMKHPLISWEDLERDPSRLVGNGKSFFASSSSGSNR